MAQSARKITTDYKKRLATDAQLKEELEQIQKRREGLEEELKMLGLKEGLINDERKEIAQVHARDSSEYLDMDAINDLADACANTYSDVLRVGDTSFHMSEKIISALKNCQEQDTDFINAILFIFRLSGAHIDLDQIEQLNYKNEMDREIIKELLILMNDKIDDAIEIIKSNYIAWRKSDIKKRIEAVKRAQKDFEQVKKEYYEKYVEPRRKEMSEYLRRHENGIETITAPDGSGLVIDVDYEVDDKKEAA